jgi:hypothetical protein
MSEQLFKALIKNDNDEALSEFKSAIQQKLDTAMNVRRIGLTSEIFNGENSVPVTEEVKLEEESKTIQKVKEIVSKQQAMKIDGVMVDMFTASAIAQIYDKVNDSIKKKMDSSKIKQLVDLAYKIMKREEVELEEAVSASKFVKGGDDKIKQSEVDMLLGKIYDDSKLTKDLISSKAYGDGESNPKKKNPYKKDTLNFHLYQLGQQVELSRR